MDGHGLGQVLLPVEFDPLPFPFNPGSLDGIQLRLQPLLFLDVGEQAQRTPLQLRGLIQRCLVVGRTLVAHQPDMGSEQEGRFQVRAVGVELAEIGQNPIGFTGVASLQVCGGGQHQRVIGQVASRIVEPDRLQCSQGTTTGVEEGPRAVGHVRDQRQPGEPVTGHARFRSSGRNNGIGRSDLGSGLEVLRVEPITTDLEKSLAGTIDVPGRGKVGEQLGVGVVGIREFLEMKLALGQQEQGVFPKCGTGIDEVGIEVIADPAVLVELLEERLSAPLGEIQEPRRTLTLQVDQQRLGFGVSARLGQVPGPFQSQTFAGGGSLAQVRMLVGVDRGGILDCRKRPAQRRCEHIEATDLDRLASRRAAQQAGREQGRNMADVGFHGHP